MILRSPLMLALLALLWSSASASAGYGTPTFADVNIPAFSGNHSLLYNVQAAAAAAAAAQSTASGALPSASAGPLATQAGASPLAATIAALGGSAGSARANLGAAASGVNGDITSLTGLTTPLSVAQGGTGATTVAQLRDFYPSAYGAIGDDVADDAAHLSAMCAAARTYMSSGATTMGAHFAFASGTIYKVLSPTNCGTLSVYPTLRPIVISGEGSEIDAEFTPASLAAAGITTTNPPVLDLMGDGTTTLNGLQIYSGSTYVGVGIAMGRISTTPADRNAWNNVTVAGLYSLTACYNMASETWHGNHVRCYNNSTLSTSYGAIWDAQNHFGFVSPFAGTTLPVDTGISLDDNVCTVCEIKSNASTGGPTVWLGGDIYRIFFNGGYLLNQAGKPQVVLYAGVGQILYPHFAIHMELGTVPNIFQISGTSATPVIVGLTYEEQNNFATTSIFAADAGITSVTLYDPEIRVANFINGNSTLKVFDTPSIYTVKGAEVHLPSPANWNAPATFTGRLCSQSGGCKTSMTGGPYGYQINGTTILTEPNNDASSIAAGGNNGTLQTSAALSNVWYGQNAGANVISSGFNVGIGQAALKSLTTGVGENIVVGYHACQNVTTGSVNDCLGYNTGATITTETSDTLVGAGTDIPAPGTNNYLNLGGLIRGDKVKGILLYNGTAVTASTGTLKAGSSEMAGTVTETTASTGVTISWPNANTNPPSCTVSGLNGTQASSAIPTVNTLPIIHTSATAMFSWQCVELGVTP